ncbi:hypothetical protein GCG21_14560 [Pseudactinotalea sp. HY160]|uniref:type II toxin-antitoxin system RelE/ParE family toxin n=1 Tax=Pseudactinotalea sp. HY160 TaxID=2654490 RepID=UPI00128B8FC6|nr:hypothetical protein [Pseudactinotalea sp. HY160]
MIVGADDSSTRPYEIRAAVERIGADSGRGRACDEIREGYRRYGIGSHLVFYVEMADSVDIVRHPAPAHGPDATHVGRRR